MLVSSELAKFLVLLRRRFDVQRSFEKHLQHLQIVLIKGKSWNLYRCLWKYNFVVNEVEYPEDFISSKSNSIDHNNVQAVKDWARQNNKRDVEIFFRMIIYNRRNTPHCLGGTKPLRDVKNVVLWRNPTNKLSYIELESTLLKFPALTTFEPR